MKTLLLLLAVFAASAVGENIRSAAPAGLRVVAPGERGFQGKLLENARNRDSVLPYSLTVVNETGQDVVSLVYLYRGTRDDGFPQEVKIIEDVIHARPASAVIAAGASVLITPEGVVREAAPEGSQMMLTLHSQKLARMTGITFEIEGALLSDGSVIGEHTELVVTVVTARNAVIAKRLGLPVRQDAVSADWMRVLGTQLDSRLDRLSATDRDHEIQTLRGLSTLKPRIPSGGVK